MILTKENLSRINNTAIEKPYAHTFLLPEKVLQFGTGVLLRGLPDYFIHQANQRGQFNGRVAVVKSTAGDAAEFHKQDGLYTLCIRGIEQGQTIEQNLISSAISRVILAEKEWADVLKVASSPDLQLLISNTTEVGIIQVNEAIEGGVPDSFPAKVLAVLYQRFKTFKGAKENGLVIIATELIPDNGKRLEAIVKNLAQYNQLESAFIEWLSAANIFCNSLVDRIVPGRPDVANLNKITQELGYTDGLLIMTEPYRLWAIEGDERVKAKLEFANANEGVIIAEDIEIYRELKVRLLNGTHTLTAALAFLMQMDTVNKAMKNPELRSFMQKVMKEEISKAIPYPVTGTQAKTFADAVTDRFTNPYIEHLWYNITFQYTMKMKIRVLPLLVTYYARYQHTPEYMCLGVAAYLRFMQVAKAEEGKYYGDYNGNQYLINDEHAAYFSDKPDVYTLLSDQQFWGVNFSALGDFIHQVDEKYREIERDGIIKVLLNLLAAETDRI